MINAEDARVMADFYNSIDSEPKIRGVSAESLLRQMDDLTCEECLPLLYNKGKNEKHKPDGSVMISFSPLSKWIDRETHFILRDGGLYKWDDTRMRFIEDGNFGNIYRETRTRVLHAAVRRGIFYLENELGLCPLMCSLKPYMDGGKDLPHI